MAYVWDYGYTGNIQHVNFPPGVYLIECWGAGGGNDRYSGGKGGYTKGIFTAKEPTRMHICVGGAGQSAQSASGRGFPGGGCAGIHVTSGSGGGITFVAAGSSDRIWDDYEAYKDEILLVAGAGGGGGYYSRGGDGNGGSNGEGWLATPESGYSFGWGEHCGSSMTTDMPTYAIGGHTSFVSRNKSWTLVASLLIRKDGVLTFDSYGTYDDTYGKVVHNSRAITDDDSGGGRCFLINVDVKAGDHAQLYIAGYNSPGECWWMCKYPVPVADGGGGGAGYYGGYAGFGDVGGGGGSGYINPSRMTSGSIVKGGGSNPCNNGWIRITLQSIVIHDPLEVKKSKDFSYAGWPEGIKLLPGLYKFEAWGASGGGGSGVNAHTTGSCGGMGGYTSCIMKITSETIIYALVGGAGFYGSGGNSYGGPTGGWNGGGNGGNNASGSGGGATDFRVNLNSHSVSSINPFNDYSLKSRFCVAGGGGGSDNGTTNEAFGNNDGSGGSGGGIESQGCYINGQYRPDYRVGQTWGNALGQGAHASWSTDTGGAGGGWYGGYCSSHSDGGAGGGSSYIKGYPGCNTAYTSYQGSSILYSRDGVMNQNARSGHGFARITRISPRFYIQYEDCSGDKPYVEYNEIVTANMQCAENEYAISWSITEGYSFYSETEMQAKFKAPDAEGTEDITITITGNKGQYADLVPINCKASMWYIKPNTKIRLTAIGEKIIDDYLSEFVNFFADKDIFTKTKISDYEAEIMTTQLLPYDTHYVEAIYAKKRVNSNIYKLSQDANTDYEFLNEQE